jgi:hypothetical protein
MEQFRKICQRVPCLTLLALGFLSLHPVGGEETGSARAIVNVLWSEPSDLSARNLFYGPGGSKNQPSPPFVFLKEDKDGANPKFDVRDANDVEWTVKLGREARSETAVTRLVWAAGYFASEVYFMPEIRVATMRPLSRGQDQVEPGGIVHNVRLKRHFEELTKTGKWSWNDNPFEDTRELNGLRVLIALVNDWDLKSSNNAIYETKRPKPGDVLRRIYMVSDLGASLGQTRYGWGRESKGNLEDYAESKFIEETTLEHVSFATPGPPQLAFYYYPRWLKLRGVGRNIPREDAKWIGGILGRLSPGQIRDAFRAAGFTPDEIEGFARIVESRIAKLHFDEDAKK